MVECTALEMRHTGNRIGGSNPSLSATQTKSTSCAQRKVANIAEGNIPMIKISELLVRKKDMSRGEFHDYWKRVHGPLVMSIPEIRRHVVKDVQSHTQPDWFPFLAGDGPQVRRRCRSLVR